MTQDQLGAASKRNYAGTAGALAVATIPQAIEPGGKMVGVGVGTYRNEAAMALGVSYRSNSGAWVTKAGVSADTRGGVGAAVGVGFNWR